MEHRREQPARGPRREVLQDTHQYTMGRGSSSRDVAGEPFLTVCSMSWYRGGAPATGGSGGRGSAARIREMKSGSSAGSSGRTGA